MAAYIIVGFTPKDMELLQEYSAKAASTKGRVANTPIHGESENG